MKFKSSVFTQASGSVGGLTYARNRGGMYTRARSIPVNPDTALQKGVRAAFSTLTQFWRDTLTPTQRSSWTAYAANVLIPDRFGDPTDIGGLPMFVRNNVGRLQAGLSPVLAAGAVYNLGEQQVVSVEFAQASAEFRVNWASAVDDWNTTDGAGLLVYVSKPVNPTVNFYKGPYKFAGSIDGDSGSPPSSPQILENPQAQPTGTKVFGYCRVSYADGRLGNKYGFSGIVTATLPT